MANNRLYIQDANGERLMVAKSFGGGWEWRKTPEQITEWLSGRDMDSSYGGPAEMKPTVLAFATENETDATCGIDCECTGKGPRE